MTKKEILKRLNIDKLDDNTIFITNQYFKFAYFRLDSIVKEEFREGNRYYGGLQCGYDDKSQAYKDLENWLCDIAEKLLNIKKN